MKKNSIRIPKQFLGAFKRGHRQSVREFIDESLSFDLLKRILNSKYEDKEAISQLEYITKFNNEYHRNVIKKGDPEALHNTDELRKDLYSKQNSRARDLASKNSFDILSSDPSTDWDEEYRDEFLNTNRDLNHEDTLIELIDFKNKYSK